MAEKPRQVLKVARVWNDPKGGPWLVVYELAQLAGRWECVGMSMRSYLRHFISGEVTGDGLRDAIVERPMTRADLEADIPGPEWLPLGVWEEYVELQSVALEHDVPALLMPRALSTLVWRRFPLAGELKSARRGLAREQRSEADSWRFIAESVGDDLSRQWADDSEALAKEFERPPAKSTERPRRGRPPVYDDEYLRRLAARYQKLMTSVSATRSPIKDLAEELGVPRRTVEKLVARCRRMKPPLIPPYRPSRESGQSGSDGREPS